MNNRFKVWHKEMKQWMDYEEVFIDQDGNIYIIEERTWSYQSYMHKEIITEDVNVIHSTGTFDNENNELFEGDICWFTPLLVETLPTFKGVIEWDKYRYSIRNLYYKIDNPLTVHMYATPSVNLDLFGISVNKIGNRFENPELLQDEK